MGTKSTLSPRARLWLDLIRRYADEDLDGDPSGLELVASHLDQFERAAAEVRETLRAKGYGVRAEPLIERFKREAGLSGG